MPAATTTITTPTTTAATDIVAALSVDQLFDAVALPQANATLSMAASLGITFPFNVLAGIPLYLLLAQWLHGS